MKEAGFHLVWYFDGGMDISISSFVQDMDKTDFYSSFPQTPRLPKLPSFSSTFKEKQTKAETPKASPKCMKSFPISKMATRQSTLNSVFLGGLLYGSSVRLILRDMGCDITQCHGEADLDIECDVRNPNLNFDAILGLDSDFMFCLAPCVYIPFDSLFLGWEERKRGSSESESESVRERELRFVVWNNKDGWEGFGDLCVYS